MTITLLKDKIFLLEEELRELKVYMQKQKRNNISIFQQEEQLLKKELEELKNELYKDKKACSSYDYDTVNLSNFSK